MKSGWLPMFYSASLEGYAREMSASAEILTRRLAAFAAQGQVIDMRRVLGQMTMDVVGTCAFGIKLRTQEEDDLEGDPEAAALIQAARDVMTTGTGSSLYFALFLLFPCAAPLLRLLATYFPDRTITKMLLARHTMLEVVKGIVERARKTETSVPLAKGEGARGVAAGSFIHLMLSARHKNGRAFTTVEIVQQALTFLLGGYETTASSLAFCVYCLAANLDKMAKLCAEVDKLGPDIVPSVAELSTLPYLDAVFKETLRLYPPGFVAGRIFDQDYEMLGHQVPKGTAIYVNIFGIQRDSKIWQQAEAFIPERWIDGEPESAGRPAHGWMAFGEGAFSCVGTRFAQEEAKITLIRMFQRFTFKLVEGQEPLELAAPFLTMGPKKGVFVIPQLREQ
eukprot:jgi/Botrbrau1/21631/Bobra.43_1s0033.1